MPTSIRRSPSAAANALLVLALALAAAAPVRAADRDGAYFSQRPDSCREFLRVHRSGERRPEAAAVRGWIAGYITAYNRQTADTYDITGITEFDQVLQLVEKFCKDNALSNLGGAMEAVTEELHPTRYLTRRQAGR